MKVSKHLRIGPLNPSVALPMSLVRKVPAVQTLEATPLQYQGLRVVRADISPELVTLMVGL
jgi:hypothetical protein